MRKYMRNLNTNYIFMGGPDKPDFCIEAEDGGFTNDLSQDEQLECGIDPFGEGGSYFDELAPKDNRTSEELFPGDFENGENAGAGDECDIESMFNERRRENQQEEIHDPDCNPDNADQILEDLNS